MTNTFIILIGILYFSAMTSFLLSMAAFSHATRVWANIWTLGMIFGLFTVNYVQLMI